MIIHLKFAYLQVNYRGSSGYGRSYREALKHNWGEIEIEDVYSGIQEVIKKGIVDTKKIR